MASILRRNTWRHRQGVQDLKVARLLRWAFAPSPGDLTWATHLRTARQLRRFRYVPVREGWMQATRGTCQEIRHVTETNVRRASALLRRIAP